MPTEVFPQSDSHVDQKALRSSCYPSWLEKAVFYQIYPHTFLDTNGDGIGDLEGIRQKLPYLKNLGIDCVWISPIYVSPFRDAGYDVADYYNVAPRYKTPLQDDLQGRKCYKSRWRSRWDYSAPAAGTYSNAPESLRSPFTELPAKSLC